MNPRYSIFIRLFPLATNWEYMAWIAKQSAAFRAERKLDKPIGDQQDEFTAWLQARFPEAV